MSLERGPSHVNPSYCRKGEEAKKIMLETLRSGLPSLKMDELFEHIDLLWEGILSENFVFNFKNGLYIKAYDALEKETRRIANSFQEILSKIQRQKETELGKREGQQITELCNHLVNELKGDAEAQRDLKKQELEHFFADSHFPEILEEWRIPKFNEFNQKSREIIANEVKKLTKHQEDLTLRTKINAKLVQYRKTVSMQAKEFAKSFNDDDSEEKLEREVNSKCST